MSGLTIGKLAKACGLRTDTLEPMPAPVKALAPDDNGNYRFACDVTEPGDWELDLSAQISGEKEPVHGAVKFQVMK